MDPNFKWLSEENTLPLLERKWQETGELSENELTFLNEARQKNPDIRVRETCRVLLAAIAGQSEGEPHVQRHLRLRNQAIFQSKVARPRRLRR